MPGPQFAEETLTVDMTDSSSAQTVYIPVSCRGWISSHRAAIAGAIGTADNALTLSINGTAQSHLALTLAFTGSAAGSTFGVSTNRQTSYVKPGDVIAIASDGAGSNTVRTTIAVTIRKV